MQSESFSTQGLLERRLLPRLNFKEAVQFRNLLKSNEVFSGSLSRDLSAGGLRITTAAPFAKDARLVLLLALPGASPVIRAISKVAWNTQKPFGGGYESGLQFIEITSEDRNSIAGFVERGVVS